jgi:hypothetical protein
MIFAFGIMANIKLDPQRRQCAGNSSLVRLAPAVGLCLAATRIIWLLLEDEILQSMLYTSITMQSLALLMYANKKLLHVGLVTIDFDFTVHCWTQKI